ncbi:HAD family hydrolase [Saccharothrix syringae]|uniref:HAD-IB family hydrolase n=1 Tax=Saccharothrix syringae TaxID=103733 RepID=A0A5Q0H508_SACSY|nr:HAD-IB family hydrolase [Saccharothrix syringae]QFZ21287.1 HAD-IB family hydrolase [Saccharothrix syringae]
MSTPPAVAFFDVDETVIKVKSMFEFLRHWMTAQGDDGSAYESFMAGVRELADAGVPRAEVNRHYYRRYAGASAADVRAAGEDWYASYRRRPDGFLTATVAAVAAHRAAGNRVVLVSGSFLPVLGPLMADVGADEALCGDPEVGPDGRYTGAIAVPMIGENKTAAVRARMAELGVDPADCYAYGDHQSDLGMLEAVGNPVVVGEDPVLVGKAEAGGWRRLPATTGPLGVPPRVLSVVE